MAIQDNINIFGKVLPIILDIAGLIPGLNIPVNAIKIVEDGVNLEETTYTMLMSPDGKTIRDAITKLIDSLGLHAMAIDGKLLVGKAMRPNPPGYTWDIWQGWVAK
jgi:hypothetical protein